MVVAPVPVSRLEQVAISFFAVGIFTPLTCAEFESRNVLIQFVSESLIEERLEWLA